MKTAKLFALLVVFILAFGFTQLVIGSEHEDDVSSDTEEGDDSVDDSPDDESETEEAEDENETEDESESDDHIFDPNTEISRDEAIDIARNYAAGALIEAEQGYEHGVLVWEVKLLDGTAIREVKVNANTGAIVDLDGDDDRDDDSGDDTEEDVGDDSSDNGIFEEIIDNNTIVTGQDAINIAKAAVNGAVERIEQGYEDGILVWKVRLIDGSIEREVYINAETGEITRITSDDTNQSTQEVQATDTSDLEKRVGELEERVTFFERVLKFFGLLN